MTTDSSGDDVESILHAKEKDNNRSKAVSLERGSWYATYSTVEASCASVAEIGPDVAVDKVNDHPHFSAVEACCEILMVSDKYKEYFQQLDNLYEECPRLTRAAPGHRCYDFSLHFCVHGLLRRSFRN